MSFPSPFPFRAIAFDVDGTLYSLKRFKRAVLFHNFLDGLHWLAMEKARKAVRRDPPEHDVHRAILSGMAERLRTNDAHCEVIERRLIYHEWPRLLRKVGPYEGASNALSAVKAASLGLVAFSDYPAAHKLEALGLGDAGWDAIIDATAEDELKPGKAGFLRVIEAAGCAAEHILYVGDSIELDLHGAKGVGMKMALVGGPYQPVCEGIAPDFVFESQERFFEALSKALNGPC